MYSRNHLLFFAFSLLFIFLFLADLAWGSVAIPAKEIYSVLLGKQSSSIYTEIIVNFRLPKAITAILAGASLSVAGLMMQTLFRTLWPIRIFWASVRVQV